MCPRCHHRPAPQTTPDAQVSGGRASPGLPDTPRCPEHGLACVAAREVVLSSGDPLLGMTVAGRFTILGRLGTGSMGAVYRARQETIGRDVALKVVRRDHAFDAETRARFLREARATSMLTSVHTVSVLDFGEADDGSLYLAIELLEGETLGTRLRRQGALAVSEALMIARQALLSLMEAHGKGIVHRDLKPDNLFLVRGRGGAGDFALEHCKVLDFGIAMVADDEDRSVDLLDRQASEVFGTPRYMSPEQAQGAAIDARSDLYSLGVLLYQMLAGRPPFVDDDAMIVMARHIQDAPADLCEVAAGRGIPAPVASLVRRALSKHAEERPQSAAEFIREIDGLLAPDDAAASGPHATSWTTRAEPEALQKAAPRQRGARVFAAMVGVSATCAVALGIFHSLRPNLPRSVNQERFAAVPALAPLTPPAATSPATSPAELRLATGPQRPPAAKPVSSVAKSNRRPPAHARDLSR
jgi:eukaryotic-like serine/threonine-protein kinase